MDGGRRTQKRTQKRRAQKRRVQQKKRRQQKKTAKQRGGDQIKSIETKDKCEEIIRNAGNQDKSSFKCVPYFNGVSNVFKIQSSFGNDYLYDKSTNRIVYEA